MKKFLLIIPSVDTKLLMRNETENTWIGEESEKNTVLLEISSKSDEITDFEVIYKNDLLKDINNQDIIEFFLEKYLEYERDYQEQKASGVENTDDENDNHIPKPDFDPEDITIRQQVFPVFQIVNQLLAENDPRIDLSPDFQRHFVWKEVEKKSRLIESLLLRIPLPVFYLAENDEGNYQVVDGVQRLTTIRDFVNNKFKLKKLEYLEDCQEKSFKDLLPKYQRRLNDTQFTFNVISVGTPAGVKTEIFKRLNLGGKPLNRQEIRNSLAKPTIRKFIKNMAESDEFKIATNHSIKPLRMEDQELVMRYIAFYLVKIEQKLVYKGDMEGFLDEVLEILNKKDAQKLFDTITEGFFNSMQNAQYLFDMYAFRKILPKHIEKQHTPPINKSLFTVWSVLLAQYDTSFLQSKINPQLLVQILVDEIQKDSKYFDALTTGTSQPDRLSYGFDVAQKLIDEYLKPLINA